MTGRQIKREEEEKKQEEKEQRKEEEKRKKKPKKERTIEVKKVAEEWEIWDEEEEVKKLVQEHFHKWIHIFGKKQSERISSRKL